MTLEVKPLAEVTHEAISLLCKTIGVANTMRFINTQADKATIRKIDESFFQLYH